MMFVDLALFWFVLLGSKLVLGAVAVYLLLARDSTCELCDAELLPLEHPRGTMRIMRVLRLQRRWCIECRRVSLTRSTLSRTPRRRATVPVAESRFR